MRTKQFRVLLFITTCLGVVGSPASGYSLVKKESRASELSQDVLLKEISGGFSKIAAMATPAVVYIESFPKTARSLFYSLKSPSALILEAIHSTSNF